MSTLTQVRAREIVDAVIAEWAAISVGDLALVLEHRGADRRVSRIARDALLRPLVELCIQHRDELRCLQLRVLSRGELNGHAQVGHPSRPARRQAKAWGRLWADLARDPRDLLSGYLLALVGLGFTQGVEIHAFTEDIPELLIQLRTRLGTLPPHDVAVKKGPVGFSVSAALHEHIKQVLEMPRSLKNRLRNLCLKGPCTYEQLASTEGRNEVNAARNDLLDLRRLKLVTESTGGRSGRWKRWEATPLGLEAMALLDAKYHHTR